MLGFELIIGIKRRYSLLGVSEWRVIPEVSQTVYSLRLLIWGPSEAKPSQSVNWRRRLVRSASRRPPLC